MGELGAVPSSMFPDLESLTAGLTAVFNTNRFARGRLTILRRKPSPYCRAFPCEIVTCRFQDGSELQLFCKYATGIDRTAHGHRGGIDREIEVYRDVVQPLDLFRPEFFGAHRDSGTGQHWLILEYLDDSLPVAKIEDPSAMVQAARWIARFHAANEVRLAECPMPFLKTYDMRYYLGWVHRTAEFTASLSKRFPWVRTLCERSEELLAILQVLTPTIIHGEYYPHNILYQRGRAFPVDWESAAIAEGLIDLATLTEGWPEAVAQGCEVEYWQTRWPKGPPAEFRQALNAARLYLQFRWLGERSDWTTCEHSQWRFDKLRSVGEQLGVI